MFYSDGMFLIPYFKFSKASSPSVNGGGRGTSKISDFCEGPSLLHAEYLVPTN